MHDATRELYHTISYFYVQGDATMRRSGCLTFVPVESPTRRVSTQALINLHPDPDQVLTYLFCECEDLQCSRSQRSEQLER